MALIRIKQGEQGWVYPGDVVFSETPGDVFPLHIGIYVEEEAREMGDEPSPTKVCGVPGRKGERSLGIAYFDDLQSAGGYVVSGVGQRRDVSRVRVQLVALFADSTTADHSKYGRKSDWGWKPLPRADIRSDPNVADGRPFFACGTCAQFVEWLYEKAGLDIVAKETVDPAGITDVSPMTQMHAFYRGEHPLLVNPWDPRLASMKTCIFGEPDPRRPRPDNVASQSPTPAAVTSSTVVPSEPTQSRASSEP